jgi:putative DNA primase/helicase
MSATAADLARQLKAKRTAKGWIAKCPAHDDQRESLAIGNGENGKLLLHCFAGCGFDAILKAAGIEPTKGNGTDHIKPRIVATYDYVDARGELIFQVCRKEPKDFPQRRPDGNGGWVWGRGDTPDLPYRLPQLLDAAEVYICEGEKDCDNLAKLGLAATTNPKGAGKWPATFGRYFAGRHAILIPDNDQSGRDHVQDVAKKLYGKASSIRVLDLPDLPPKGDVSDWLAAGGTREQLEEMAAAAPHWQKVRERPDGQDEPPAPQMMTLDELLSLEFKPVKWIVPNILCEGLTIFAGRPKLGKSWGVIDWTPRKTLVDEGGM